MVLSVLHPAVLCLVLLATLSACAVAPGSGTILGTANINTCTEGTAQLIVGDGYQQIVCGCQEAPATFANTGRGDLTCTVSTGTVVFFHYNEANLQVHQIVPVDGESFPASPIGGRDGIYVPVFGFKAETARSYAYFDAFDEGLTGQIISQ